MFSTKCKKFKGEIENYLRNRQNQFESKIDRLFVSLRLQTCLRRQHDQKGWISGIAPVLCYVHAAAAKARYDSLVLS